MKRTIALMICLCTLLDFTACGSGSSGDSSDSGGSPKSLFAAVSKDDLNIDDFDWEVEETKIQGYDCYALSLTNNSKYDLLGIEIDYKLKDEVTDDQLKTFDSFMEDHSDYIDEDQTSKDVMLRGDRVQYVASGDSVSNIPLAVGIGTYTWSDIPDEEQFNLMQPDELMVGVIGDDNKLYLAYYDIEDGSWKIDSETTELNKWSDMEIAKLIPKPEGHVFKTEEYENINSLDVDIYGVSEDDFKAYVEKLKEAGFTDISLDNEGYFSADNENGNRITANYDDISQSVDVSLSGESEE